jgi:predicted transcriptional regulator
MPIDLRRRDALIASVAVHNRDHKQLPNSAVRLLEAMFASDDVCQQSTEALEELAGLSRKTVQKGLHALLAAGVIAKEDTGAGRHANRYRLLLTAGSGAR